MSKKRLKSHYWNFTGANNVRVLKIVCTECGGPAIIRKTNKKHREISDVYCACSDVECGHTFVLNLTFSHTLSPSAKTGDRMVKDVINHLNPAQRQLMLNILQSPPAA